MRPRRIWRCPSCAYECPRIGHHAGPGMRCPRCAPAMLPEELAPEPDEDQAQPPVSVVRAILEGFARTFQ